MEISGFQDTREEALWSRLRVCSISFLSLSIGENKSFSHIILKGWGNCGEELQSIEAIFAIYLHLFSSHNFLQFSNLRPSCRTHKNLIQLLFWFVSVSFCYKTNSTEFMMQFYVSIIWAGRGFFFFFYVGFSWGPWCICSQLSGQLEVVWGGKSQDGCVCSKWSLILLQAHQAVLRGCHRASK